jgi:polyene glycosyltransferase
VLFACQSRAGNFNPVLAIAAEFSRRAVPDLWFASYVDSRSRIEAASTHSPIRYVPLDDRNSVDTSWDVDDVSGAQPDPMRTTEFVGLMKKITRSSEWRISAYRNMLDVIDRIRPKLMVIDILTPPAIDAAMTREVPFVVTLPSLPSSALRVPSDYPSISTDLPRRMSVTQRMANDWRKLRLLAAILTRTNVISFARECKAAGIKNSWAVPVRYTDAAALVVTASVFGLEYDFPVSPRTHLIGAFLPSEPDDHQVEDLGLLRWLDDSPSVVYLAFGTLMRLSRPQLAALLEAVRRLGPQHRFLWKLPEAQQALLPTSLPDNLRVESWIPSQLGVLAHPHVRAFVTHGGSNGFHESIYFGKPVVAMPAWTDCYAIARRAVDSGVGLAIDRPATVTGDEATAKIRRILTEESFRQRAEHWAQRVREAGGVTRATDLILQLSAELSHGQNVSGVP